MQWLSKKMIVVYAAVFACCAASATVWIMTWFFSKQHIVESEIGTILPKSTQELNYYWFQPSTDLYEHWIYIKFRASKEDYLDLMRRMGVQTYDKADRRLYLLLPGHWKATSPSVPQWWDPSIDIPDDTAMMYYGDPESAGWTVAKYENGYVYIVIYRPVRLPKK